MADARTILAATPRRAYRTTDLLETNRPPFFLRPFLHTSFVVLDALVNPRYAKAKPSFFFPLCCACYLMRHCPYYSPPPLPRRYYFPKFKYTNSCMKYTDSYTGLSSMALSTVCVVYSFDSYISNCPPTYIILNNVLFWELCPPCLYADLYAANV